MLPSISPAQLIAAAIVNPGWLFFASVSLALGRVEIACHSAEALSIASGPKPFPLDFRGACTEGLLMSECLRTRCPRQCGAQVSLESLSFPLAPGQRGCQTVTRLARVLFGSRSRFTADRQGLASGRHLTHVKATQPSKRLLVRENLTESSAG